MLDNEKAAATQEIVKSIRELLSLKVTLPLGNPNLKHVHTNQFLWLPLPDEFELANFEVIAKNMNNTYNRWIPYEKDRWYIEGVTITNDGGNCKMELDLNPFPSSMGDYKDGLGNLVKAYEDLVNQQNKDKQQKNVASVPSKNTGVTGGEGKVIDNLVKKIIGNETRPYHKAKKIHEWLLKNRGYSFYYNAKYSSPEQAYNHRWHINCADTSILTRGMMASAGLDAWIVHGTGTYGHYWTQIKINGKVYNSDCGTNTTTRKFNKVWENLKPDRKCGKKPC